MNTELLLSFVSVAEHGGFSAAARALNRTQSAVSLQIKRLEEQLGTPVFRRTSRKIELTPAGGTFLPYARRLLQLQDEAMSAAAAAEQVGSVRLGLSDEQAAAYLPTVLPGFTARFPAVPVEVTCDLSPILIDRLQDGLLDLALVVRHGPTATGRVVARQSLVWVAATDFRLDPGRPVPLAVNPEGCVYRAQALAALSRANRKWRVAYTSQSSTGINIAVALGMAVAIKAARSVPPGCRVLGAADGLPPLAPAQIELHRAPATFSRPAELITQLLLEALDGGEAGPAASFSRHGASSAGGPGTGPG